MPNDYRHYSVMVKPIGSLCNLNCDYCYYIDKKFADVKGVMSDELLENYIRQIVEIHGQKAVIEFAWHGGEPTIAGIPFYKKALQYQNKYASGRKLLNTLQTNGTLLDDEWCSFFKDNDFRIGISIDGPENLHNFYRKDSSGNGTFNRVMNGLELLQKHNVEYNTLTTVNASNAQYAREVYSFLRSISDYMQFLPVVESVGAEGNIALPPGIDSVEVNFPMASFNVQAEDYGRFLCDVFDYWLNVDVGNKFVQIFEATIGNLTNRHAGLCVHEAVCGHCAVVERDGNVYRCDRYVFDEYKIGNIKDNSLELMMESNRDFGQYKLESLPSRCLHCDVVELCFGGCPKDRLLDQMTINGIERRNYLCAAYRMFFRHFKNNYKKIFMTSVS